MTNKYDVINVGGGPAGLYTAYGLTCLNQSQKKPRVLIIEKGKTLDKRACPAIKKNVNCVNCKTCSIMSGVAGAGAFSDGKFPITNDFGGNLWELIGKEESLALQRQVDTINFGLYELRMKEGWDKDTYPKLYSSNGSIYKKICTQHNLHLLDADIRHLGTDKGQIVYGELYKLLEKNGVDFLTETTVNSIEQILEQDVNNYYCVKTDKNEEFFSDNVVVAAGRSGSEWVSKICENLKIPTKSNRIDIGVRFECQDEIWSHITKDLYESKIVYRTKTYADLVRTFCMNPSGEVVTENTDGFITVNGHAFEDENKKTHNTNFALLVSQTFTEPFNGSNEYGNAVAHLSNLLGQGVVVQRYGDLIRHNRSTHEHMKHNTVTPTLNAEPGDLSFILPKRIFDDILEMIEKLDHIAPGMTNDDNLIYGVELKRYNCVVEINNTFEPINYKNLFFIGDGCGITHSLSQASAMGLAVSEVIKSRFSR